MLSWYLKVKLVIPSSWRAYAPICLVLATGSVAAADYYSQPAAELSVDVNTNRELVTPPTKKETVEGYFGQVGTTLGIATARSDTTIRPQIGYIDYPKASAKSTQELLDFSSYYQSQRSNFNVWGRFDHRDTFSSELASAGFDSLNPNIPTAPETGRISSDSKRTLVTLTPSYQYQLTQRTNVGASAIYESANYSGNGTDYTSYDYPEITGFLSWALNPRTRASVGIFGARYSAKNGSRTVNTRGANLALEFKRSAAFNSSLELTVERDDNNTVSPTPSRGTSNSVGATYTTAWQTQRGKLQLSAGRFFTPSGSGGIFRADQFQVSYDRDLTQRFSASLAAHYVRYAALLALSKSSNYDYVNTNADLTWMATRKWYVAGGVGYLREQFAGSSGAADNLNVHIAFGYKGLGRRS